jgi:hypothetical protein
MVNGYGSRALAGGLVTGTLWATALRSGTVVPTSSPAKVTDFPHLILSTARPQRDRLHPVDGRGASKQIIT